jgi:hypothetical protein
MTKDENMIAEDTLHDIAQAKGLGGKQWSVDFARKMGWSAEEIERYLSAR